MTDFREFTKLQMAAAGYPSKKRTRSEPKAKAEIKFAAIREAISAYGGHRKKAAERLQISEATLYRALRKMKADKASEGEKLVSEDCTETSA